MTNDCPEPYCGLTFPKQEEVIAHLQWDHNHTEFEAEQMFHRSD